MRPATRGGFLTNSRDVHYGLVGGRVESLAFEVGSIPTQPHYGRVANGAVNRFESELWGIHGVRLVGCHLLQSHVCLGHR
jgi:hypothetical protein